MTHQVELPALDGRDVLGFLASLGTMRLLIDEVYIDARLSFNETNACAVLHSQLSSIDEIVDAIVGVIRTIPEDGVIPAVPAAFPIAKAGMESDPMRAPRDQVRSMGEEFVGTDNAALARWFAVVITDLATDSKGRAVLTPYTAPAGQQSLRSFFSKPLDIVRKDPTTFIREALTRWRRVDGYTGEYLDHRAVRGAADHPSGKSVEAGVPGATWLAIMALPLLRLTGTGTAVQATLWHDVPGRRQPVMAWPLWRQPLDLYGIAALLEHPALRPVAATDDRVTVAATNWAPLGIFAMAGAARRPIPDRKSAGVLTPLTVDVAPSRATTGSTARNW